MTIETTEDAILGGRLLLRQPRVGDRVAIEPILLAAAVPARPGDKVLDAGTGTAAAALCLARRVPEVDIDALEIQAPIAALAAENVALNGMEKVIRVITGDIANPPASIVSASYDHVMTNPPYYEGGVVTASPVPLRRMAHVESLVPLKAWIGACLALLRPGGTLTVIHRADRQDDVLAALGEVAGDAAVYPLWAGEGKPARRVIIQAVKGGTRPVKILPGLVLHGGSGKYTEAAEAVLRHAGSIAIRGAH